MRNLKIKKQIRENSDFGGYQSPELRGGKKVKNCQFHICGFHCVAKYIGERLKSFFFIFGYTLKTKI
jgi:hypothetical protein